MKVLIADDHDVVRRGLKQILEEEFHDIKFGEARDAEGAIVMAIKQTWDAVVLDITMPGKSGFEALKEIRSARPKLPIIILSVQPEDQYAIPVLKAGASGYLTKDSASAELVNAFKKVLAGGKYVSPAVAEKLASSLSDKPSKAPHERLSVREFQVMRLLASGNTPSRIASDLKLSVQAVSTYRSRILQKLKITNNADLVRYAMQSGLVK